MIETKPERQATRQACSENGVEIVPLPGTPEERVIPVSCPAVAPPDAYRYERKCAVRGMSLHGVVREVILHPAMFRTLYPPRMINNIYFDTPELACYFQTVNGLGQRNKYRLRWYGKSDGNSIRHARLEVKGKRNIVNTKHVTECKDTVIRHDTRRAVLRSILTDEAVPVWLKARLRCMKPVLLNRYERQYFTSADRRFRLTVDTNIGYGPVRENGRMNMVPAGANGTSLTVVEVKYDIRDDEQAHGVLSWFPFRVTRNSKYTNGIDTLRAMGMV